MLYVDDSKCFKMIWFLKGKRLATAALGDVSDTHIGPLIL